MAAIALFLLAACAQAAAETAAAQQRPKPAPPSPLEASLGLLWDRYEDPGRIEATIWLKNVSKRPIIILKGDVGYCCTLECTGPDGVKGPKLSGGHVGSQICAPDVLKPGETYVAKATYYTGNVVCRDPRQKPVFGRYRLEATYELSAPWAPDAEEVKKHSKRLRGAKVFVGTARCPPVEIEIVEKSPNDSAPRHRPPAPAGKVHKGI